MSGETKVPWYYYPAELERFKADTSEHEMEIVRDEGLYRHIRFRRPAASGSSWYYWYELITTPGQLTIRGDMGAYVFSRVEDMFEFFAGAWINAQYWAEKLLATDSRSGGHREYSEDRAKNRIHEHFNDHTNDLDDKAKQELWGAIEEQILDDEWVIPFEHETRRALAEFRHEPTGFEFTDSWEWDLQDFTPQYLWCCHAIQQGIKQYRGVV